MKILRIIAAILGLSAPAMANNYYGGPTISTTTGYATQQLSGIFSMAASSITYSTYTIILNGVTKTISASTITAPIYNGPMAMTVGSSITLTGSNGYISGKSSVTASAFFGDGSHLSNLPGPSGENPTYSASSKTFVNQVGIGTVGTLNSSLKLDVNGTAQIGPGAIKSTFTAAGSLLVPGNLGLGISAPSMQLHISGSEQSSGTIRVTGTDFTGASNAGAELYYSGGAFLQGYDRTAATYQKVILNGSSMEFQLQGISTGVITSGGNLGVANTNPQATLDVGGNAQFGLGATKSTFTAAGILLVPTKIGLKTPTPSASFEIGSPSTGSSTFQIYVGSSPAGNFSSLNVSGNSQEVRLSASRSVVDIDTDLGLFVDSNSGLFQAMRIRGDSGNIGINTTLPQSKLEVNGGVSWGSGAVKSTGSTTGDITMATNADLTLTGSGSVLTAPGPVNTIGDIKTDATTLYPNTDNADSLGKSTNRWVNAYVNGYFVLTGFTKAQIAGTTPAAANIPGLVNCSDCAIANTICQSTGTTIQGFKIMNTANTECK